ncbi:hypothetical protein [Amycolatopsis jejuensis]|uniref:hypothetical protein n=1 Tax=Amycolatopsis jejuensis TaxID=330084 RepID=UPI000525CF0C|nr:hypothetical protein [Amycolatopsis jejuensis]
MAEATPLRVLFCIGINQNFFDLPLDQSGQVWAGFGQFMSELGGLDGVTVIGSLDDDVHQVGPSGSWPWTAYLLADVADQPTVGAACNLLRTVRVGEHALWKYARIEARIGRSAEVRG